jgi:hypothetical protein
MAFRISLNSSELASTLPNLADTRVDRPATGDTVVAGANPHSRPPRTASQDIAEQITQERAKDFLAGLQNGNTPRGGNQSS